MADMTITGDARFGSVISEMKRVEKASDSLKRKVGGGNMGRGGSQRGGMGVLEISRGVEDFAVAGMRGLLNNIPGIIMSLGGGMGLAGAVSLAAVGITLFGKKLLELTGIMKSPSAKLEDIKKRTDAYAAANMKAKNSLAAFNAEQARAFRAAKSEAAIDETMRRVGDPQGMFRRSTEDAAAGRQIRDTLEAARNSLKEAMGEEVKIKLPNVADVEEDLAMANKLLDDLNKKAGALEFLKTGIADGQQGQNFGIQFADVEAGIARATADIEFFRKRAEDAKKEMKSFGSEFIDLASTPFDMTPADKNDPLSPLVRDGLTLFEKFQGINKESKALAEKAELTKIALEEQKRILEDGAKSRADQLAAIEKELEANAENSAAASKRLEEAKRELNLRKELLEIEKKRAQFGELNDQPSVRDFMLFQAQEAKRIDAAFKDIDSVLSRMGLAGGDMLSSSGKIGGSVTEYNSAIATINYQRDTLKELRTIARNTAKKLPATYN